MLRDSRQTEHSSRQIGQAYLIANEVISMAVMVALFAGGGYWLDARTGLNPLLTFCGAGLGCVAAGFSLRRILQRIDRETAERKRNKTENKGTSTE